MIAIAPLVVKSPIISQLNINVHKVPVILQEIVLEMLLSLVSLTGLCSTSTQVSPQHEIK